MRILLVIDHLDSGGAQHQMVTLARGLVDRGHFVSCFVYYPHMDHHRGALEAAGIEIHEIAKPGRFSPRVPWKLRHVLDKGFDVALSYLTTPNIYNLLASIGTGIPTIVSERSALRPGKVPLGTTLRYQFYRLADRILVNSDHHRQDLGNVFRWMRPKLVTIRNGVDLDRFRPGTRTKERTPNRLDLLAVGSVHVGKNFIGLIEALHLHREDCGWTPNVQWVGRMGSRPVDVQAFEQAEHLIDRYELRDSWQWLGVRRDVPKLLQEADALIHPSFFEGLPNVVCEALASGLPVLAGRVCDQPWLVEEGVRGLLFDPAEPLEIARAIQQFSALPNSDTEAMRRRSREFAESELSLDKLVTEYEKVFRELAGP